jgi:acid stress-induced BolA-like protein IbaG/YrbA
MLETDIEQRIQQAFPDAQIIVTGDGHHFTATVVTDTFHDMSLVKRQQSVYACVSDPIRRGEIHALTIKAHTLPEYAAQQKETS